MNWLRFLLHDETKKEICGGKKITRRCSSNQNSTNSKKTIKKNRVFNRNQFKGWMHGMVDQFGNNTIHFFVHGFVK
jgi:hypothetical protein